MYLRPDVDVEAAEPRVAAEAVHHLLPVAPHQVDAELGGQGADAQLRDAPRADQRVDAEADGGDWAMAGLEAGEDGGDAVQFFQGVGVHVDAVRCVCVYLWEWNIYIYIYIFMGVDDTERAHR